MLPRYGRTAYAETAHLVASHDDRALLPHPLPNPAMQRLLFDPTAFG